MIFSKVLNDIKTLKIQGAENVAISAVACLKELADRKSSPKVLLGAAEQLAKTRPTEPCMQNALHYLVKETAEEDLWIEVSERAEQALRHFSDSKRRIAEETNRKIVNGMTIFTHCHSSTIIDCLLLAKKQGKSFNVNVTETRPLFQGRITATELAKAGIPVMFYADAAARFALKKADMMLIGADAITADGKVINKIGSELHAIVAQKYDLPVYVCTDSWKFDPRSVFGYERELEMRNQKEIWDKPPKGVSVSNFVFERIDPKLIKPHT